MTEQAGISSKVKRFSVPRQLSDRRVTIKPYESFREKKDTKDKIKFGYAALSAENQYRQHQMVSNPAEITEEDHRPPSPAPSIFSIYGDDPGPSAICEQPVGAQADVFISALDEKHLTQLKKYIESNPPQDHQYFMWIKDFNSDKITVISLKTLENHLKSDKRVRRVKWRNLSTGRVSVYRYSLPAITAQKRKECSECIFKHKKLCLLGVWLSFVIFLCIIVVLGSLNPDEERGPYSRIDRTFNASLYNSNVAG